MYRQETVATTGQGTPVQASNDSRVYRKAVLTVEGNTIRLVPGEGTDAVSSTFGQLIYAAGGTSIEGAGNIRMARMLSLGPGDATVGIDLQV